MPSQPPSPTDVTLARDTLHNPDEARHFMKLKPISKQITITRDGTVLARSTRALRVMEIGKDFYDPQIYLPVEDVIADLSASDSQTYCPLKGHAAYFSLPGRAPEIDLVWAYPTPLDFAADLAGLVAFDLSRVTLEERPV